MTTVAAGVEGLSVLHVSQPTDAGVGRVVGLLAGDQVRRGWRVSVASPPGRLEDEVRAVGAMWHAWPARRAPGLGTFREAVRLRRIVEAVRPDVVHLHSSKAGLAGRVVLRGGRPTIFEPHAWSFHAVDGLVRSLTVRWERLAGRWAAAIVCVSESERLEGEQAGIQAPWHVIANGVDTVAIRPASALERSSARSALGEREDVPFAVCVGRLSFQKGQDILLAAWPRVREEFPEAELALVGDGPLRGQLEAALPPGVHVVGHSDDVDRWLCAADVVLMPSRWEGMSLTLLEAMARGRSVVATDVAGMRDVLGPGSTAIVPSEAPEVLADAVRARFAEPSRLAQEGAANRTIVEERFQLLRAHDEIASLTEALAGRG